MPFKTDDDVIMGWADRGPSRGPLAPWWRHQRSVMKFMSGTIIFIPIHKYIPIIFKEKCTKLNFLVTIWSGKNILPTFPVVMLKERLTNQQNKFETIKIFAKSMKLSATLNDHNFIYFGNKPCYRFSNMKNWGFWYSRIGFFFDIFPKEGGCNWNCHYLHLVLNLFY